MLFIDLKITKDDSPDAFYRAIQDSLPLNIAVLDDFGIIIDVNRAWIDFALKNGVTSIDKVDVGVNYFEVCRRAHGDRSEEAPAALDGLSSVLNGRISYFELEYPCNSPDEKRWFMMRATRFIDNGHRYLVVTHIDITRRKHAEDELLESYKELESRFRECAQTSESYSLAYQESMVEKKRLEGELRASEAKFHGLLERAPFAIYIYRGEKNCCYVNPAAEALTGYRRDEFIQMCYWDIAHPDDREMVKARGIKRQLGESVPSRYQIRIITQSGDERWVDINASNIMYEGKPAVLVTALDITEQKRTEELMAEARAQAEVYVDLMSHDINNMNQVALGNLELFIEKLRGGKKLEDSDQKLLRNTYATLQNISRLIDNVRKIQKVKSGILRPQLTDIGRMIAELVPIYENIPDREVVIRYRPVTGYVVQTCELIKDVFVNILDNAIKHSTGPLLIVIGIEDAAIDGKDYYKVTVEDNGPGIPDSRKREIFERYRRGETKARGRGLGLYLVKTLVEDFSGKVWVEDRVKGDHSQGSKFIVMLPAVKQTAE